MRTRPASGGAPGGRPLSLPRRARSPSSTSATSSTCCAAARLRGRAGLDRGGVVHDLALAARFADRLVLLDRGQVLAAGTAEEGDDPRARPRRLRGRAVIVPAADRRRLVRLRLIERRTALRYTPGGPTTRPRASSPSRRRTPHVPNIKTLHLRAPATDDESAPRRSSSCAS